MRVSTTILFLLAATTPWGSSSGKKKGSKNARRRKDTCLRKDLTEAELTEIFTFLNEEYVIPAVLKSEDDFKDIFNKLDSEVPPSDFDLPEVLNFASCVNINFDALKVVSHEGKACVISLSPPEVFVEGEFSVLGNVIKRYKYGFGENTDIPLFVFPIPLGLITVNLNGSVTPNLSLRLCLKLNPWIPFLPSPTVCSPTIRL